MSAEKIVEKNGRKYSEMLMKLVEKFDENLPTELTFEETLEVGIEAWNIANNKEFLQSRNLYEPQIKSCKYSEIVKKMVDFKIANFSEYNNTIIDYSTENDILKIKTQTQENNFESIIRQMINIKPINKEK
ncbi:hypothetical protein [Flavobacterium psychrophilum]|uniref:hypothetical protein n=1 Tax=Flavobacterium psychrophilum TaxID=96345 RepID=UPI0004F888D0|nr:hypothetical protein [Flavobacterium psychrophilum]AIN75114.1 hypothetical protein FPG3_05210 [Flavobacterium psychrophilum FPG3]EKT2071118.1 hypothetical protein [Flavobacterium psychrophilum]EKT3957825.1 hypothetical protein [Flavobacterium psychrophilum]EKT3964494.1 hypothetical protein [Flavobacterium psychrophilum]EKT3966484.1 hypothetical protein [Flavobacterium psychrophilum]